MGKVLGIVNRKGGVGKTTTATTLSYLLSKEGCKVALIDFDGQRHTTKLCGVTAPEQLSVTIYDILKCIVMNEELPDKESYMIRTETGVQKGWNSLTLDDISIAIISLIRAGAVFRFVYCMVRLQGAEEEQAQYRKRAKNTVLFYIVAESIWQIKDIVMYYYG